MTGIEGEGYTLNQISSEGMALSVSTSLWEGFQPLHLALSIAFSMSRIVSFVTFVVRILEK